MAHRASSPPRSSPPTPLFSPFLSRPPPSPPRPSPLSQIPPPPRSLPQSTPPYHALKNLRLATPLLPNIPSPHPPSSLHPHLSTLRAAAFRCQQHGSAALMLKRRICQCPRLSARPPGPRRLSLPLITPEALPSPDRWRGRRSLSLEPTPLLPSTPCPHLLSSPPVMNTSPPTNSPSHPSSLPLSLTLSRLPRTSPPILPPPSPLPPRPPLPSSAPGVPGCPKTGRDAGYRQRGLRPVALDLPAGELTERRHEARGLWIGRTAWRASSIFASAPRHEAGRRSASSSVLGSDRWAASTAAGGATSFRASRSMKPPMLVMGAPHALRIGI